MPYSLPRVEEKIANGGLFFTNMNDPVISCAIGGKTNAVLQEYVQYYVRNSEDPVPYTRH